MRHPPPWVKLEERPPDWQNGWRAGQTIHVHHRCQRCGAEIEIRFPILAADWEQQAADFADRHRGCLETKSRRSLMEATAW